jgi:hypothetical protein
MTNASLPGKVNISDNVLFQQIGAECVLLDMESEQYFGLDDVAGRFWQILSEDSDTEKALAQLQTEYDVDEATLRQDLLAFINKLEKEKLITIEA